MKLSDIELPQNIFLIIALIFCTAFIFVTPPFQAPDEPEHLFKMYGYTEFSLNFKKLNNTAGQILPENLVKIDKAVDYLKFDKNAKITKKEINGLKKLKLDKEKTVFYEFVPSGYSIVSYFPAFLVLWVLKIFNIAPFYLLMMMKFFSMFVYIALAYSAISVTPVHKNLFMLCALLPVSLFQGCAINPDCMVIGIGFLFIAYSLKLALDESVTKIGNAGLIKFALLFSLINVMKFAYFPLILLYFIIPSSKFESKKIRFGFFAALFVLNAVYDISFFLYSNSLLQNTTLVDQPEKRVEKAQLYAFIFKNPIEYLGLMIKTVLTQFRFYLITLTGCLGWYNLFMMPLAIWGLIFMLFASALCREESETANPVLNLKMKLLMFFSFLFSVFIILTAVFLIYQCYPVIYGLQGRYLTPIILLFFLLFDNKKIKCKFIKLLITIFTVLFLCTAILSIMARYYA